MRVAGRSVPITSLIIATALALGSAAPVAGQDLDEHWYRCLPRRYETNAGPPDEIIAACTALISSGIQTQENLALALVGRAGARFDQDDFAGAVADYDEALRLNPRSAAAYSGRARVYADQSDLARALSDFDRAIEIDPQSTESLIDRGGIHQRRRNYDLAIADFDRAIQLGGNNAHVLIRRGNAYQYGKRDVNRALADYDQAVVIAPEYALGYRIRGDAHLRRRDYARAVADYDEAIRLSPRSSSYLRDRCFARAAWGQQLDAALADCNAVLEGNARDAFALESRGYVHLRRAAWSNALQDFQLCARP